MKHLANVITLSRIVFAVSMILAVPFLPLFWMFCLLAGISDIVDGYVARKFNSQCAMGAKLDSIADLVFALSIFIVVFENISILYGYGCSAQSLRY